jgi:hypothetical protein
MLDKKRHKFLQVFAVQIDRYSRQARLLSEEKDGGTIPRLASPRRHVRLKAPTGLDNKLVHQSRSSKIHFEVNFRYNPD